MSTLAVRIEKIVAVEHHPDAHSLDIVQVLDWECVTARDQFKVGDLCVYFPIDSVITPELEEALLGKGKTSLHNGRIRTIKLRGAISQGLAASPESIYPFLPSSTCSIYEGRDLTELLNVKKYEPPQSSIPNAMRTGSSTGRKQTNPNFRKYTDIENAKNHPLVFTEGERVIAREKIHGTNFRAGVVTTYNDTWWKKLRSFFGFEPKNEFVHGSRTVNLSNKIFANDFYTKRGVGNVYAQACIDNQLERRLRLFMGMNPEVKSIVVYGEIYGHGIQKGYTYGCKPGEQKLILYDIEVNGKFLDDADLQQTAKILDLPTAPLVYSGPFDKEAIRALSTGASILDPNTKVREGLVVRPEKEEMHRRVGRKLLKYINPEYLLKDQSDFH